MEHQNSKAAARRILAALTQSHPAEPIDFTSYAHSDDMRALIAAAAEETLNENNFGLACAIYEALDHEKIRESFVQWFCRRTGSERKGVLSPIKFIRSTKKPDASVKFIPILRQNCPTGKVTISYSHKRKLIRPEQIKKVAPQEGGLDMLNHPARLPGSYGTGKGR